MSHTLSLGQANGLTDEQILDIQSDGYMESGVLSGRQKAAALWAEHVAKNTAKDRDDVFDILAKQFTEPEIVELTLLCGWRNMRTRFHDSLHLDLESHDFESVGGAVKVDPKNFKRYLEKILQDWPDEMPEPKLD